MVAPAVDPASDQANEQLRLAIDQLRFIAERMDRLYDRALFELRHHVRLAEMVCTALAPDAHRTAALRTVLTEGKAALAAAGSPVPELRSASAALAHEISAVVRDAAHAAPDVRRAVNRAVITGSAERVAFERAWYAPLGIDPDRDSLPALESVLERPH